MDKIKLRPLPQKPSEWIRRGLEDLRKCEADDKYQIDMAYWHEHAPKDGVCVVCLAGSVMAKSLGVPITTDAGPWDMVPSHGNALRALDEFRLGCVSAGLFKFGIEHDIEDFHVENYSVDPDAFHRDMTAIAEYLEHEDL